MENGIYEFIYDVYSVHTADNSSQVQLRSSTVQKAGVEKLIGQLIGGQKISTIKNNKLIEAKRDN